MDRPGGWGGWGWVERVWGRALTHPGGPAPPVAHAPGCCVRQRGTSARASRVPPTASETPTPPRF